MPLVSKSFSQIITFTRASTATYFDATGTLQSAAIDAPRFDYDPDTLAARGFLIEEARTNLLTYSNDFTNPVWASVINGSGTTPTVTASYTVSPDGTANATRLQASIGAGTASTDYSFIRQNITGLANPHDVSVTLWMKSNTGVTQNVYFRNSSGTGSAVTASVTTSWQRFTFTLLGAATTTDDLQVGARGGLSDATIDISIYGGQMEIAAFATSYIPTTTTALTRSADVASVNTLSPWYNATESTLFMEVTPVGVRSVGSPIVTIDDGTTANRITLGITASNTMQNYTVVSNALSGNTSTPATTYAAGSTYKIAFGVALDNVQSASGGASGVVDTTALIPSGLTALKFAAQGASTGLNNFWFKRVTYYPRRLSSAELAAITA